MHRGTERTLCQSLPVTAPRSNPTCASVSGTQGPESKQMVFPVWAIRRPFNKETLTQGGHKGWRSFLGWTTATRLLVLRPGGLGREALLELDGASRHRALVKRQESHFAEAQGQPRATPQGGDGEGITITSASLVPPSERLIASPLAGSAGRGSRGPFFVLVPRLHSSRQKLTPI